MNNHLKDGLDPDLPPWPVDEPSGDFAARVADRLFSDEQGTVAPLPTALAKPRRSRGRAIVVPLLVAVVFCSAAAAAGWGILKFQSPPQAEVAPVEALKRHYELPNSPAPASGAALSEPEGERIERLEPPRAPAQKPSPAQPKAEPARPPGPIKSPPCHCTTGAAICSCFD